MGAGSYSYTPDPVLLGDPGGAAPAARKWPLWHREGTATPRRLCDASTNDAAAAQGQASVPRAAPKAAGRWATLLTLAGAPAAVIAPKGLSPPGQACGATSFFHLAVGAAQPPADQALDACDYERVQEEEVTLQRPAGVCSPCLLRFWPRCLHALLHFQDTARTTHGPVSERPETTGWPRGGCVGLTCPPPSRWPRCLLQPV